MFAVKVITPFVTSIVTGSVPLLNGPGSNELLNQIYLPAGVDVPLKFDVNEASLMVQPIAGLTVTTTDCVLGQPLDVKVYTYVTSTGEAVVLIKVSEIVPAPLAAGLLIPVTDARLQLNVVPEVVLAGVYVNTVPLAALADRLPDKVAISLGAATPVPAKLVEPLSVCVTE